MSPLIYTAELTLDPEDREAFLQWYAFRHAPDLYPIGFQVCTCYQAVLGDMTFLDIYEIPGLEIFDSRAYAAMAERDIYAAEVLAKRRDKAHTIYQQQVLSPKGAQDGPSLDADWISVLRFDTTAAGEELSSALDRETEELAAAGATRVRFAERTRDHPTYTTHRPHFLLMAEWPDRPSDEESLFQRIPDRLGDAVFQVPFLGYRVYPWPNVRPSRPNSQ